MNRIKLSHSIFGMTVMMLFLPTLVWSISPDDFNKVTFVNNIANGKAIEYLFFSPGDSQYWGPDILDKNHALAIDKSMAFFVFYPDSSAKFDFMAVDADGKVYEINGIEVVDGKEKTITINGKNLTSRVFSKMPMTEVMVSNATDNSLDFAFFAPADSKVWGLEVLNTSRTLRAGEEVSFLVLLAGERFDMEFMAIAEDGREYQKNLVIKAAEETLFLDISSKDLIK